MKEGNKQWYIYGFIVVALLQLLIPAQMIWKREAVLKSGEVFHFRTAPIDPNDPFRGKYVVLNFEDNRITIAEPDPDTWQRGATVYLSPVTDADGFAQIRSVNKKAPDGNVPYFKGELRGVYNKQDSVELLVHFPFDRYYLDEFKAPAAEEAYFESLSDRNTITYAKVRVGKGIAVTEDIMMGKQSLREMLED